VAVRREVGAAALGVLAAVGAGVVAGVLFGTEPVAPPSSASLVQPGTRPLTTRQADLDGDGQVEVAVSSVAPAEEGAAIPVARLEVFTYRNDRWVLALDASAEAPRGAEGAPATILASPLASGPGQIVELLDAVDFAGDDVPELVVGVLSFGATAGPLELWVIAMDDDGAFRTELYDKTQRGGRVIVDGRSLILEQGVYEPGDPGCCPSSVARERIAWDETRGRVVAESLPAD
jgi:hypothetical protein